MGQEFFRVSLDQRLAVSLGVELAAMPLPAGGVDDLCEGCHFQMGERRPCRGNIDLYACTESGRRDRRTIVWGPAKGGKAK